MGRTRPAANPSARTRPGCRASSTSSRGSSASASAPPDAPLRKLFSLQRRERRRLEDAALLALVRAELAALGEVFLERRIGHQRVALLLAIGLARVLPHVHHLVELPDFAGGIEHRLAAMLHLRRMAVLLVELEPRRELVVVQGVDAQIENHSSLIFPL